MSTRVEPFCDHQRQLDHLDTMLHAIKTTLDQIQPLVPLIPRALSLLDPGRAMRRKWGKDAVPKSEAAPVHVGEASEDRPPMGA